MTSLQQAYESTVKHMGGPPGGWLQTVPRTSLPGGVYATRVSERLPTGKRREPCQHKLQHYVDSRCFSLAICVLIVMNSLLVGWASHLNAVKALEHFFCEDVSCMVSHQFTTWEDYISVAEIGFNIIFCVELVLRAVAGDLFDCNVKNAKWRFLDLVMGLESFAELAMSPMGFSLSHVRILRLLRLLRLFRMIRLLQFARLFRTLRLMVLALSQAVAPLLWAVVILVCFLFFFGVILLDAVSEFVHKADSHDSHVDEMRVFFWGMPRTMLTLFMSVTGGIEWTSVFAPLLAIHTLYGSLFVVFVTIMILVTLNTITGIFVAEAVEMATVDQDILVQAHREENRQYLSNLRDLFNEMDPEKTGQITLNTFQEQFERDEVKSSFRVLGLEVSDTERFFKILDVDQSQQIQIEEFVMGCLRLKGNSTVDIEFLMQEAKQMIKRMLHEQNALRAQVAELGREVSDSQKRFISIT